MLVNVSEAKTNLSDLINRAYRGEHITIAKHNLPMVDLVVHKPKKTGKRKFGMFKGKLGELSDVDWFAEDKELNDISSLINRAYQGEKITFAKHNMPMVDLVVHQSNNHSSIESAFGLFKDKKIDALMFQNKIRNEW